MVFGRLDWIGVSILTFAALRRIHFLHIDSDARWIYEAMSGGGVAALWLLGIRPLVKKLLNKRR